MLNLLKFQDIKLKVHLLCQVSIPPYNSKIGLQTKVYQI